MPAVRVRFPVEPTYTIKPLDQSTWPAFAALVERNNGIFGGCWCMAFHPEGGDRQAQGELNRERKHARVRSGRRMRRWSSTARTASAGASSALLRGAPDQEPCGVREGSDDLARLADRVLLRRQGASASGRGHGRSRRCAGSHRGSWRGHRRGIPGGRRGGTRRVPVERRAVDLRQARVLARPQDRQAPLGHDTAGRIEVTAAREAGRAASP